MRDGDAALLVDEQGERHSGQAEFFRERVVADHGRVGHLFLLPERCHSLEAAVVHGDAECGQALVLVLAVVLDEVGQFKLAAAAPGGPEVQDNDFAALLRQPEDVTGVVGQLEVRCELPLRRSEQGVFRCGRICWQWVFGRGLRPGTPETLRIDEKHSKCELTESRAIFLHFMLLLCRC